MDEFGIRKAPSPSPSPPPQTNQDTRQQQLQPHPDPLLAPPSASSLRSHTRAESPAPFSHYANATNVGEKMHTQSGLGVGVDGRDQGLQDKQGEDDGGAGCCKCVVM